MSAKKRPASAKDGSARPEGTDRTPGAGIPIAAGGSVLRPPKAAESVARDIVKDIRALGLRPGDNLPSEAEMLKDYEVSRESLREGLRLLEVQGMITIRRGPGGGPQVGTVDSANLGRMEALYFHLAGATYEELFEAWIFSEGELARRAAANPDAELRAAVMEPYLSGDVDEEAHDDLEVYMSGHEGFHGSVAGLAGNKVFQISFRAFGLLVAHHIAMIGDVRMIHDVLVDDHLQLARIIADGDVEQAGELMERHLRSVIEINRAQFGTKLDGDVDWL
ncbi:FadR/GntR family transcriptional regulator [Dietzia aurantiaca]|uniref:FadR/GntR family transcriptional regulator n=1 Tax=Dietzia aurantiaca TaxID=983873 RepID=A0ABV9PM05_9ACTN